MSGLRVAVIGATGALGSELLRVLEGSKVPVAELVPMASRGTTIPEVEFKRRTLTVHDLLPESLEGVDLAFAALPPGQEVELLAETAESGCLVIDLAQNWASLPGAPVVVPGVEPEQLDAVRELGLAVLPKPTALAVIELLMALRGLGVEAVSGTAMLSASAAGRGGIEELSRQVAAMFNSQDPPRQIFPDGLAFDIIPSWGDEVAGWTDSELWVARHAGAVLGLDPRRIVVTEVVTPVFLGLGLSLRLEGSIDPLAAARAFEAYGGTSFQPRSGWALHPRAVTGDRQVHVGRLRPDPGGGGLHLFAVADPIRLAASRAVELVDELIGAGLL